MQRYLQFALSSAGDVLMEAPDKRETATGPGLFREKITDARRRAGRQQQELARALGLAPHVLSRKLHGLDQTHLTHTEVKQLIQTLAAWDAITTQDEANELLALMGLKLTSFSEQEWKSTSLNRLDPSSRLASPPAQRSAPPSASRAAPRSSFSLPAPMTSLIGRQSLVQLICIRLRESSVRLLTLLGPGGIGKTRVSLEVARQMRTEFADGVFFVSLASIHDPTWVPSTIARAISLTGTVANRADQTYIDLVKAFLSDKQALLVLDNFEHLLDAGLFVRDLLEAAPALKVLVTSRAILHLSGEHLFGVPALPFPDPHHLPELSAVMESPAIRLFAERARAVNASFRLTEQNAPVVAQICAQLDGLPLAIELAAARARLLSPEALLARLERRLETLTQGPRDAHQRQQTLRNTLAWSYDLLTAREQRLFRRLSVFVGGCTLWAIEAMYQALGDETADLFEDAVSLLDKSLLHQRDPGEEEQNDLHLSMLEMIREFGLEVLKEQGEFEATRDAHARYYLRLAEEAEPHLAGPEQGAWFDRLDREQENLRAVLQRSMSGADEQVELASRLGIALSRFWTMRGHASDARRWLEWVQTHHHLPPSLRARALAQAAALGHWLDEYALAQALSSESLVLYRELGDAQGMAWALYWLGDASQDRCDYATARARLEEALSLFRQVGDQHGTACTLEVLAKVASYQGAYADACALAEEALALFQTLGDKQGIFDTLERLARCCYLTHTDPARACVLAEEALAVSREVGDQHDLAYALRLLGLLALERGEQDTARTHLEEALRLHKEPWHPWGMAMGLCDLAGLRMVQGDYTAARSSYEACLQHAGAIGDKLLMASCLEGLAGAVVAQAGGGRTRGGTLVGSTAVGSSRTCA
jgi:predicted ATPase